MKYLAKPFSMFLQIGYSMDRTPLMKINGTLFANDLLATDLVIGRFLNSQGYTKNPDGSANINLAAIIVETQAFYLFTHKLLISALLMMRNYLPLEYVKTNNFPIGKFGKFYTYVYSVDNDLTKMIKSVLGPELDWAKTKIIDKRDKMVQHWTTNPQNQLSPMLQMFDLPVLTYQHQEQFESSIDNKRLSYWTAKIAKKYHIRYSPNNGAGHDLAFLEAWYPKLEVGEKKIIDGFLNPNLYIALPVSPVIVNEVSAYLEKVAEIINKITKS